MVETASLTLVSLGRTFGRHTRAKTFYWRHSEEDAGQKGVGGAKMLIPRISGLARD